MKPGKSKEGVPRAVLYMRLSRDDEGVGESASISTQRDILRAFAEAQGFAVAGEYADDGFSGTSFERPELLRMLRDIEAGGIDCVLVKDLSRLGRNSARTAQLLEEVFPRHGVRCISVSEGFDSLSLSGGMAVAAPFLLLMNELYARDTSQKIRAALQARMRKGAFISAFAPYGYRKDPADRNRLLVDEEAAAVVRRIFLLAAEGRRPMDIARELNAARIPTPSAYRALRRPDRAGARGQAQAWSSSMLCKLLRNAVYLGQTEQGKTTKLSFKSRETRVNPREDWVVVRGTHEPLVSQELFEAAQRRTAARRCAPGRGFANLFSGLAVCADCGRHMSAAPTRKKGSGGTLCCGGYKARGAGVCSNHFVDYDALCSLVQQELRSMLALSGAEREALLASLAREECGRRRAEAERTARLRREKEGRLRELRALARDALARAGRGELPEGLCRALLEDCDRERAALEEELRSLRERSGTPLSGFEGEAALAAGLDAVLCPETLSPALVKRFLLRIEVGQGRWEKDAEGKRFRRQPVKIVYRFPAPPGKTP